MKGKLMEKKFSSLVKNLFANFTGVRKTNVFSSPRHKRLSVETLESRQMLSVTPVAWDTVASAFAAYEDKLINKDVTDFSLVDNVYWVMNSEEFNAALALAQESPDSDVIAFDRDFDGEKIELAQTAGFTGLSGDIYIIGVNPDGENVDVTIDGSRVTRGFEFSEIIAGFYDVNIEKVNGTAIYASNAAIDLQNVTISDSASSAIYADSGNQITISGFSKFTGNSAAYGGAIYASQSSLTITDTEFSGNTASFGGAVYVTDSTVKLENALFENNTALFGGGILAIETNLQLLSTDENNPTTFTGNTATQYGG
ncbi:MAG: hypothetical protein LBT05_03110, partial [Planctomycetaceae bacterium]|nr:hypothetical protein [Planctomycetaceae bacterium]